MLSIIYSIIHQSDALPSFFPGERPLKCLVQEVSLFLTIILSCGEIESCFLLFQEYLKLLFYLSFSRSFQDCYPFHSLYRVLPHILVFYMLPYQLLLVVLNVLETLIIDNYLCIRLGYSAILYFT